MKTTFNSFKKLAAVLSAAVIAVTMSGCADNGYIMTVDGMPIRNGVYLSMQRTSFSNAQTKIDEANGGTDSSDSTSSTIDVLTQIIEGKTYSDWVKADTLKGVKRFVGIQRYCEQFGIKLTDEELSDINSKLQEDWNSSNYYLQFMGMNSMGEYYESLGISIDSMREVDITNALNDKLFLYYYGEGGEKAVSDDEIDRYMEDNFATYKLLTLPYLDYMGDIVLTAEEKQEIIDRANSYADQYNDGASFVDIQYAFDLKSAQDDARKEAEESYSEEKAEGLTEEEYIQKAIDEAEATKGSSDDLYDAVITRESTAVSEELRDYIFDANDDGVATVFEGTTSVYVVIRQPILDLDGWREENAEAVLWEMKNDEFNSMMELMCQNYDVEQNDYLVDKKYAPEKMRQ